MFLDPPFLLCQFLSSITGASAPFQYYNINITIRKKSLPEIKRNVWMQRHFGSGLNDADARRMMKATPIFAEQSFWESTWSLLYSVMARI